MSNNIIIYGKGDFAKIILYYLQTDSVFNVVAFCVDKAYIDNDTFCDLPLIAFDDIESKYPSDAFKAFVAVGYSNMRARTIMYKKIKTKGYDCINYISSKALIDSSVKIGENNVILENTVLEPFVKIENNNVFWSSCNICHDVEISSHSFFASQSLIGGFSKIKNNCFLGFNATVIQNIELGQETLIGAKSLVTKDTRKYSKYVGIPAKYISSHETEGIGI